MRIGNGGKEKCGRDKKKKEERGFNCVWLIWERGGWMENI